MCDPSGRTVAPCTARLALSGGVTDLSVEEQSEEEEEDESDFAHKELGGLEELGSILSGGFGARDPWAEIALSG